MSIFLEPIYLNEKMVLNCAAYLFKGVSMDTDVKEATTTSKKGNLKLGFKFLQDFISPLNVGADISKNIKNETKTARRYTMGGLHMTVLDQLKKDNQICEINDMEKDYYESYVNIEAMLQPVDFYAIVEVLKRLAPMVLQILKNFGPRLNPKYFSKKIMTELPKFEKSIVQVINELEDDYLKSKQLEMMMFDPKDPSKQIGIVDLDVTDVDPVETKGKLTDGRFHIIGKVTKYVPSGGNLSLVQRTFLSTIVDLLSRLSGATDSIEEMASFKDAFKDLRPLIENICQLQLSGPAYRVMAMSVCV